MELQASYASYAISCNCMQAHVTPCKLIQMNKIPLGQIFFGKNFLWDKIPLGQFSFGTNFLWDNFPLGQFSFWIELPWAKFPLGNYPLGQIS